MRWDARPLVSPLRLPVSQLIPRRIFPYEITISALALIFLFAKLVLISQRLLLPGIVVLGSFILFVLWLTGLIETSILLYGPKESVCNLIRSSTGESETTLAWLETNSIFQSW